MKKSTNPGNMQNAIEITNLTRRFGAKIALDNVSLTIPTGAVMGLIGENGAGKTTLLKHLVGLLKAESGQVSVLGHNPVSDPVGTLSQIGYYSEDQLLPGWMSVEEQLRFQAAFYPTWDWDYARQLCTDFALARPAKVKTLSRGFQAKLRFVLALAHKPKLLILDEPNSGLDPVARKGILEALIRSMAEAGSTVLFSSHLLDDLERVAESVAMISEGKLIMAAPLDEVKSMHKQLVLAFDGPLGGPPLIPSCLSVKGGGREWQVIISGDRSPIMDEIHEAGGRIVAETDPSLDEIFVAHVHRARRVRK